MDGPRVPSAMEEAEAQIKLDRERATIKADQDARDKIVADAEKADKIAKATNKQAVGYQGAVDYGNKQATNRGFDQALVDKYGVKSAFTDTLDATRRTFDETNANPVYGERTAYDDAVADAQGRYRGDLTKQLDTFAGDDFANKAFADTADDELLEAILGQQRGDVEAQINASKARGTLNDTGYQKALQKLAQQTSAGRSTANDLGLGVLGGYRTQLNTAATNERNKANAATFANTYDPNSAQGKLNDLRTQLGGRLEGDINKAVSGQSFFDPSSILSYGTTQQGYYNPSKPAAVSEEINPLLQTFTDPNKKTTNLTSNTGTGTF